MPNGNTDIDNFGNSFELGLQIKYATQMIILSTLKICTEETLISSLRISILLKSLFLGELI